MNFKLTTQELIRLHSLLEILPLLVSPTVPTATKQDLIVDAAGDEVLRAISAKAYLQLKILEQKQEQRLQATDLDEIELGEGKFDLKTTLKRLIEQQQSCNYERGWVLFRLKEAIDFANLTQEQWFTIAEDLDFQRGWAWHQYQQYSNSGAKSTG